MSEELEALDRAKEAAAEAKERKHLAPVSLTMAILAVFVAAVSLLGHRAHTEEILLQNKVTDTWAYYQAKGVRARNLEALDELLQAIDNKNEEKAKQADQDFQAGAIAYHNDQKKLYDEAQDLERELQKQTLRANIFDVGEVFLEIALVVTSITLLTDNRRYWYLGMALACVGIVVAASGLLVRWFPETLLKRLH
jgi:uncharacterized protein DUF4337